MDTKSQSQYPLEPYTEIEDLYSSEKCFMWSFYRQEIPSCPQGHICDVIGVVIFVGRPERVRKKGQMFGTHRNMLYFKPVDWNTFFLVDGQRSEMEEYRWLQLADRTSDKPITIKLFSTSQPDIQSRVYPSTRHCIFSLLFSVSVLLLQTNCIFFSFFNTVALVVCTRLKLIRSAVNRATTFEYLTNTSLTQVYCTGK